MDTHYTWDGTIAYVLIKFETVLFSMMGCEKHFDCLVSLSLNTNTFETARFTNGH